MPTALEHHRSELIARMRASGDPETLFAELSHRLRILVPFDAAFFSAVDPATTLPTAPVRIEHFGDGGASECAAYWDNEFRVEDVNLYRDVARAPRPVATLWQATGGRPARSARHRSFLGPKGFDDELRAALRAGRSPWGIMSLARERGRPAFSQAEIDLVASLSLPLGEALRASALVERTVRPGGPDAPGMLLFDQDGALVSVNDAAREWAQELPDGVGYRSMGIEVSTAMLVCAGQARVVAEGRATSGARLRVRGRSGRWLLLHASCLSGPDGSPGHTALVIEAAQAAEIAPIIVEAHQLSPREQEITRLIARGAATAEIAASLHLSVHTVRDHLKAVFEKVGVSSRGELVGKLFAEHYAPAMHERVVHVR